MKVLFWFCLMAICLIFGGGSCVNIIGQARYAQNLALKLLFLSERF
jgi:hypothetical protein